MTTFIELESRYETLNTQFEAGQLSREQFLEQVGELVCQDDSGRWWSIHPENGNWHYRWRDEWRPGTPPGHAPDAVGGLSTAANSEEPAEDAPQLEGRQFPRWLIPVLAALSLVLVVTALVIFVVLPRLEGDEPAVGQVAQATEAPLLAAVTFTAQPVAAVSPQAKETVTSSGEPSDKTGVVPLAPEPTVSPELAATPEPTATPLPPGPEAAKLRPAWPETLVDDFSRSESGWSRGMGEGVWVDYRDGSLHIELQGAGRTGWSRNELADFGDAWVEATVVELASAAGIVLHVTEDHFGYVFRIDESGRYAIGRTLRDAEPPLVDWTLSKHIYTAGQANRLAVLAEGERYRFFVNGWLLDEVQHDAYPAGLLALWGGTGDGETARVVFDDLRLLAAPITQTNIITEAAPAVTPIFTHTVAITPTPSATLTETFSVTPAVTLEALTFEVSYDAWYPGSGDVWLVRFQFQAQGGDGSYSYRVGEQVFSVDVFDFECLCDYDLSAELEVRSGDGQSVNRNLWVKQAFCSFR